MPKRWNPITNEFEFFSSSVSIEDEFGNSIGVQYPLSTNGDSVYAKDIWVEKCITTGWTDEDATGMDLALIPFTNLHSRLHNGTSTNPKVLTFHFNRTISLDQVGLGSVGVGENFSNVVITILGSGGVERSVLDDSANSTKYTSKNYQFGPELCNAVQLEFYTADEVCISNCTIQKVTKVASRLQGLDSSGMIRDVTVTQDGNLAISDNSDGLAIAKGDVAGTTFVHKFGAAPDFDIADGFVTVWDGADDANINQMEYIYSTTNDIDSISSSSALDTQDVLIQGLDINYNLVTQSAKLNGQTRVTLTTPLLRVFRMKNDNAVNNTGHIYCYVNTAITAGVPVDSTKVRLVIQPGNNQTLMAIYTVPAGKTAYLRDWYASTAGAKRDSSHTIRLEAREPGKVFQLKHLANIDVNGTSYIKHDYTEPEVFREKVDIQIKMDTDQDQAGVAAGFDIVLVDNIT